MNWQMAKEVGLVTYPVRRILWRLLPWVRRSPLPFHLPDGATMQLPLTSPFASDVFCTGGYVDWGSEQLIMRFLASRPKAACIDVGANIGYYSCLLSAHATRVIAFEPDPRNHDPLRAQQIANLEVVPQAVSDSEGVAAFDISAVSTLSHLCDQAQSGCQIQVSTTTLDQYWTANLQRGEVSFVKMDVEGFEIACLMGARALTAATRPVFLIEFSMGNGVRNTIEALETFLSAHGYEMVAMVRRAGGRFGFRTILQKIVPRDLGSVDFKMLFLVPRGNEFFSEQLRRGFEFEAMRRMNGASRQRADQTHSAN